MQLPLHKVIITGTGRAGTTFLVRLLTELGLDTGFTRKSWRRDYFEHCQAGLERNMLSPKAPYIVKNPALCEALPSILATGNFVIDRAIIPIRELEAAALSRIRVGGGHESVPGGLWKTSDPAAQKAVLGEVFHNLIFTLADNDIPFILLVFPRMVEDADYTYGKLRFLVGSIPREKFRRAFHRVADPTLVHHFERQPVVPAAMPSPTEFVRARRRYQINRHLHHFFVRFGVGAALVLFAFGLWRFRGHLKRFAHATPPAAIVSTTTGPGFVRKSGPRS